MRPPRADPHWAADRLRIRLLRTDSDSAAAGRCEFGGREQVRIPLTDADSAAAVSAARSGRIRISGNRICSCQRRVFPQQPNPHLSAATESESVRNSAPVSGSRIRVCICQRQPNPHLPAAAESEPARFAAAQFAAVNGNRIPIRSQPPNPHLSAAAECGRTCSEPPNSHRPAAAESESVRSSRIRICQQPNADCSQRPHQRQRQPPPHFVSCLQQPNPQLPAPAESAPVCGSGIRIRSQLAPGSSSRIRACQRHPNLSLCTAAESASISGQPNADLFAAAESA